MLDLLARMRLVSPEKDIAVSENELPRDSRPVSKSRTKAAVKAPARKKQPMQRKAPIHPAPNVDANGEPTDSPAAKQPRRPRKKIIHRTTSYGSAAVEGDESSPEPTPADMRIGTQGIDLGTMDTSGEDEEDDEPDSDLEEFIVRSDQPIEMTSSSQRLPDDTQPPRLVTVRKRKVIDESDSDE